MGRGFWGHFLAPKAIARLVALGLLDTEESQNKQKAEELAELDDIELDDDLDDDWFDDLLADEDDWDDDLDDDNDEDSDDDADWDDDDDEDDPGWELGIA